MLKVYNTLTKQKEIFTPLFAGKVGMYSCGPTVYGKIHIGNLRAYLLADILRRYFEYTGYEVRSIKNITDVGHLTADSVAQGDSGDDKMVKQALTEKKTPQEIAAFYEEYFHRTETALNILPAHYFPRATGHIPQMITLIQDLITKKLAYEKNGNVFLDVTAFPHYGTLSGNTLSHLKVGARLKEHPDKKNPWDFALWLKAPANHLMKWESPWSIGYPGWHIECSAMSMEYLGDSFDIHTGGEDNIFPHHEAEIVQSEGVTGKPFVRYWLHNRHLLADGVKMSKSRGNLYSLEDILDKGFSAMDVRLLLLSSHYRSQMNFTWDALAQAHTIWENIENVHTRLLDGCNGQKQSQDATQNIDIVAYRENFDAALEDDLNTPQALTVLLEYIKKINKLLDENSLENPNDSLHLLEQSIAVLGLRWTPQVPIPHAIRELATQRKKARKDKDFALADSLRKQIEAKGFTLEDTPSDIKIKQK
jgi:cysteinyl-tRNA synthetase